MKIATAHLESVSPYSQSRHYSKLEVPSELGETPRDYEQRTWRHKCHVDDSGSVFIPPMAFKNALDDCAQFLALQIPGRGKSTYSKHFKAGVLVTEPIVLPLKRADVESELLFLPSDGVRGSGRRVEKIMPVIRNWAGDLQVTVFDETVLNEHAPAATSVLQFVLDRCGMFVGIGRFRPRNGGFYGRFKVSKFKVANV
jgi:hypothetical protein